MDEKFRRIEESLEKLSEKVESTNERLAAMDKTVAIYNEQLKIHIEGTVQNRQSIKESNERIETELKPIKSHVTLMNNLAKIIIFIGVLAAIFKNLR